MSDQPPKINKVTFETEGPDRFHDLFHPWYARDCGDRWLHIQRAWEFKWSEELGRLTLCKLGRHRIVTMWHRSSRCLNCGHKDGHDVRPIPQAKGCFTCGCKDLALDPVMTESRNCYRCNYQPN